MTGRTHSQDTQIAWIGSGFFALILSVGWYLSEYNKGYGEWCWGSCCFWIILAVGLSPLSEEQDSQLDLETQKMFEKKIKCRSCNTLIKGRNAMERSARGVAGAGTGGATGAIVGTMLLPGFGTIIGGAIGATAGANAGSQVSDICEKCCSICVRKKSDCNCQEIVAYCVSCGDSIARRHYSGSRCYSCSEPANGDDL